MPLTGTRAGRLEPVVPPLLRVPAKPGQAGLIVLTGPTGSGKSGIAARAAQALNAEIVCADSRQLYRGMPIIAAQPAAEDRSRVPHHLFEVLDPAEACSAGRYRDLARPVVDAIEARGRLPMVVGGSGFYINALTGDASLAPPARPETLARLAGRLKTDGVAALRAELAAGDPVSAERIKPGDTYRLVRALAVLHDTGKPRSAFAVAPSAASFLLLALDLPRAELYDRINLRCVEMFKRGALEEARALRARGLEATNPLWGAIGMPHLGALLDGTMTEATALARMQQDTRRYAKRQMTWIRSRPGVRWIPAHTVDAAVADVVVAVRAATP